MSYTAEISRINPGCFLFLVDQSGSMSGALGGQPGCYKHEQAADALNRTLSNIIQRCSQGEEIRNYFHIGVITYGTTGMGGSVVTTPFEGVDPETPFRLASEVEQAAEINQRPVRESDGKGGLIEIMEEIPEWLTPEARGGTPMCEALTLAAQALRQWVNEHPQSFPPIVINITDGAATDGAPVPIAGDITSIATQDGNALLFNIHLSNVSAAPITYPADEGDLPRDDGYAADLFRMSSVLPEASRKQAVSQGISASEQSRGYVFNSDLTALVQFLEIGTRAALDLH